MKVLKYLVLIIFLSPIIFGCKPNPLKVDISGIEKNVEFVRFDKLLFPVNINDTLQYFLNLRNDFPEFFDLFTYKIIQIGGVDDDQFMDLIQGFMNDTLILEIKNEVEKEFSDLPKTEKEINKAFKYFQYHFPDKEIPIVYFYFSGFNQSVVTAENIIGISLDKYLGRDCEYYKRLNSTPQYKVLNMHKAKIASDVAYAWAITEFGQNDNATTLLDNMVYQGKIMYMVDAMLPEIHDSLKIGYTADQLKWCKNNEAQMWAQLIEHKKLFSNNRMDIVRYINNSPSTSGFPLESPGRTGVWIGWQIVRKYMKLNPEVTLPELMNNNDYQQLLNDSQYLPR